MAGVNEEYFACIRWSIHRPEGAGAAENVDVAQGPVLTFSNMDTIPKVQQTTQVAQ